MKPLVSVCIPAYNNAPYIMETVNSILAQTYENIELIIVDDNSSDETLQIISSVIDPRLCIYHNDKNLGMSGNWNRCLSLCNGEFVKLICADDILHPQALEKEVQALMDHPEAVLAISDTKLIDLDGKGKGHYRRYPSSGLTDGKRIARRGFFSQNYFGAPLADTFRRSIAEQVGGFDPYFRYILDYDLFVSIACCGYVYVIHEDLNYFRVRKDSNTGEVIGADKEKTQLYVREHMHLLEKNREKLQLSDYDIAASVFIRKVRNFAASIYLKIFVHK